MTRSPKDMYYIFEHLSRAGKLFLSVKEPEFDFSKPSSEMIMGIITHVNQFMRKNSAATVRDKMMAIARRGLWPAGNPPFGYKRGKAHDNKLYIHHVNASIVRDVFSMYATDNITTRTILSKYRGQLAHSKILTMLRDTVYLGKINYGGSTFDGKHEPIITPQLFNAVQEKLPQRLTGARPKAQRYPFLLSGLLKCSCKHSMTPGTAKSGAYAYYTCTDFMCKRRISAPKIEKKVLAHIGELELDEKVISAVVAELVARNRDEFARRRPEYEEYQSAKRAILSDKKKIIDLLLSNNVTSSLMNDLNSKAEELERNLATVQAKIDAIDSFSPAFDEEYTRVSISFVKQVITMQDVLVKNTNSERLRSLIPVFIREVRLNDDGTCQILLKEPASSTNYPKWCAHGDSNPGPND